MTVTEHETAGHDNARSKHPKGVVVQINSIDVTLEKGEHSGRAIKATAIEQGVAIEPTFVLSVQRGNRYTTVGDDDVVKVRPGMDFIAVAPDDNS